MERKLQADTQLVEYQWNQREIENYLCYPEALLGFAVGFDNWEGQVPLLFNAERERRKKVMSECIDLFTLPAAIRDPTDKWWSDVKATDEFLDRIFDRFFKELDLPNLFRKTDYHLLAGCVPPDKLPPEVGHVLDRIIGVADRAQPAE